PSTSPEVRRIAALLKEKHDHTGFLIAMARQDGFAVWNKAVIKTRPGAGAPDTKNAVSVSDTIVYIPLVLHDGNHVNAFLYVTLNGTISVSLYRANDFETYGFGAISDSTMNAEKLAVQFMLLDYNTFSHQEFDI